MNAPPEYVAWDRTSPLLDRIGDFRRHQNEAGVFGFTIDEPKLNARGLLHAGALATLADVCIGHTLAARTTEPPSAIVTVNLSVTFLGAGRRGDWVDVHVEVRRVGSRIAAGGADFFVAERVIGHAEAVFMTAAAARVSSTA